MTIFFRQEVLKINIEHHLHLETHQLKHVLNVIAIFLKHLGIYRIFQLFLIINHQNLNKNHFLIFFHIHRKFVLFDVKNNHLHYHLKQLQGL